MIDRDKVIEVIKDCGNYKKYTNNVEDYKDFEYILNGIKALPDEPCERCKELEAKYERAMWNLGGVSTVLLGHNIDEYSKEYALPALNDANDYYKETQAKIKELEEKLTDYLHTSSHKVKDKINKALGCK